MQTPVLILVFKRPDLTPRVFAEIRNARPEKLFIAADGPRDTSDRDSELCRKTREVVSGIDWDCEVRTLFREKNLGCRRAISEAITWFFGHVEEGIILEDDCLPHQSFFSFCRSMLDRFRPDTRIMHIAGEATLRENITGDSYYFSPIPRVWGWATWRRAWDLYDDTMHDYPAFTASGAIKKIFKNRYHRYFWLQILETMYKRNIDTWDFVWTYSIFRHGGLAVNPNKNLVKNIGFGATATHTAEPRGIINTELSCMDPELKHPSEVSVDERIVHEVCNKQLNMPDSFIKACIQFCRSKISR